jgi:predicted DNA repair protein MutK
MSAGLAALLDDIAVLAKAAAASVDDVAAGAGRASMKATGVIVDDAAVTPRYVQGIRPERELPMIKRIAVGSLRNKLLFILPAALLLSELLPWLLTPILMIGGTYLCYEGAEKLWEMVGPHHEEAADGEEPADEATLVKGAIRTDFILSAEIMVISLNEVSGEALLARAAILVLVAFAITAGVYGVVGLIVKMDDVGLKMADSGPGLDRVVRARAGQGDADRPVGALEGRDRRDALGRRPHPPRRDGRSRPPRALRRGAPCRGGRPRRARRRGRRRRVADQHRRLGGPRAARRRDRRGGPAPARQEEPPLRTG